MAGLIPVQGKRYRCLMYRTGDEWQFRAFANKKDRWSAADDLIENNIFFTFHDGCYLGERRWRVDMLTPTGIEHHEIVCDERI